MANYVQRVSPFLHSSSATSVSSATAWPSNLTVGNRVIVAVALSGSTNNPSPTVSSISLGTDSLSQVTGGTISNGSGSTGVTVELWAGSVATASQRTLTVNVSTAAAIYVAAAEYDGSLYTLTLDGAVVTNTGTSLTVSTGTLNTSNATDLIVAAMSANNSSGTAFFLGTPTNSFIADQTSTGSDGGGGTGKNKTGLINAPDLLTLVTTGTGAYSTADTLNGSTTMAFASLIVGFQKVSTATPIPPLRHGPAQRRRVPHVRPKHTVRSSIELTIPPAPFVPPPSLPPLGLRRGNQKERTPRVKPKRTTRSSIQLRTRAIPAASAILRRQAQKKRTPHAKGKKPLRSNLTKQLIPPRPFPELPLAVRHPRGQSKRTPRVKAKKPVRNSIQLRIPPRPFPELPAALRRAAQRKRTPQVKAKRPLRSNLTLQTIPPAPVVVTNQLPLPVRRPQGQAKRTPKVTAKRKTRSNIQLRIPSAPPPVRAPLTGTRKSQQKRIPRIKAKRAVQSSIELRISPLARPILPPRPRAQKKRTALVKAKRAVRSSVELRIPAAPVATAPLAIRHAKSQKKRIPKVAAAKAIRITRAIPRGVTSVPAPIKRARPQAKRILHAKAKRSVALTRGIPQAQTPQGVPPILAHRAKRAATARKPLIHRPSRAAGLFLLQPAPAVATPIPPIVIRRPMVQRKEVAQFPNRQRMFARAALVASSGAGPVVPSEVHIGKFISNMGTFMSRR